MFVICFAFAGTIFNVLLWPFISVVGEANAKTIYTHLLEKFFTEVKLGLFGAACGGETLGDCVTRYFDGDVLRQGNYTQSECTENCAMRRAPGGTGENVIADCFFEGRRESGLPTGI